MACKVVISCLKERRISSVLCFLGRDVWLLEPCALCQVISLLLSQVERSSSCAELKASMPFSLDPAWVEPSRALSMDWRCPPDPRMLQPTWRRRGGGCWLVGALRARANCVQHPSKTQLLFPCRAWVIAALAALLRARGREAAQSLAPEPAQSQERLLLNFSGLWLRQEKRGCFEKDAASSPLQLCFVCQRWAPLAGAEQGRGNPCFRMVGSLTCGKMVWLPPTSGNHLAASPKTVQLPPTSGSHSAASPKMAQLPPTSGNRFGSIPENGPAASHQWEPLSSIPKNGLAASYQWDTLTVSPREPFVNKSLQLPGEGAWGVMGGCPLYPVP